MHHPDFYHVSAMGLLPIVLLLVGLWFVTWKWPQGKHMTFSQHAAQHKSATVYYFFLFAGTLPPLNIFFITWFRPTFKLSVWFNIFAIAASIFQIACTVVPEVPGWREKWHQALAGISAVLLLPLVLILVGSPNIEIANRVIAFLALLGMTSIIIFTISAKGKHPKLLIAQALYFILFFVPIILVSYM